MEKRYIPEFEDEVKAYVYNGPGGAQGEMWVPIPLDFEIIFSVMMSGRTVMFIRKEKGGILYSVDTHGRDREIDGIKYLQEFGRFQSSENK